MTRRSYGQYCAVARGLDVIGDRWTLLIVRNLLVGPQRYKDLLATLPGIGTNLLAARLRELEQAGLVERAVLPPPAASAIYRLTSAGRELEPVLLAVGRWGRRFLGEIRHDDVLVPRAYLVALRSRFDAAAAAGLTETYELRVDDEVFEVRVADGSCEIRDGEAIRPSLVLAMDVRTLNDVLLEGLAPSAAAASGRLSLTGDMAAAERFARVFAVNDPRLGSAGQREASR